MAEMGVLNDYFDMHLDPSAIVHDPSHSLFLQPARIRIGAHSRIDGMVRLQGGEGLTIGEHVHVASFCTINAGGGIVIMEEGSGCSNGVVIASGMPDLAFRHISAADSPAHLHPVHKRTVIGRHALIFANATICPGVTVGDCAVVGAGAVVTKDVLPYAVVAGVPARVIGRRVRRGDGWVRLGDGRRVMQDDGFVTEYFPKLYAQDVPEPLAVELVNFVTKLD